MPIHPTAHVDPSVDIHPSNDVGPGAIVEAGVTMGENNRLHAYAQVFSGTTLGDGNTIFSGAMIGNTPQDVSFTGEPSFTVIGNGNTFREHVTIHRGTKPGTTTVIGNECYLMAAAHVAHNCQVGNNVTFVNAAMIAGHAEVGDRAFLSAQITVHQFVRIGALVMFSGLSATNQDIPPYVIAGGRGAAAQGVNVVGLRRAGFSAEARRSVQDAFKVLYRSGVPVPEAAESLADNPSPEVQTMVEFIRSSTRGVIPGHAKASSGPR